MSSNLRIKKVCQHCKEIFIAKTQFTKFCSQNCTRRAYKDKIRKEKIEATQADTESALLGTKKQSQVTPKLINTNDHPIELIDITTLAFVTNLSESTIYRLIRAPDFPKIKIGHNLRFHKETVIEYIKAKYTVYARTPEKKGTKGR
jgi:excisionase family DNA binding protein